MKRKTTVVHMTISVPTAVKENMERHPQINWSAVASVAFKKRLNVEDVLSKFQEEGVSEEEALDRALRVQHSQKIVKKA